MLIDIHHLPSTFPDMFVVVYGALNIACIIVYNVKKDGLEV